MTPDQRRLFNTQFGGVLLALGIICWMVTFYFVVVPRAPMPAPVFAASVDLKACRSALGELGYSATESSGEVTAFEALSTKPREQLEKASIAANLCHIPMHSFCMGEGCEKPGMTLVLRRPVEAMPSVDSTPPPAAAKGPAAKPIAGKPASPKAP